MSIVKTQKNICKKYGANYKESLPSLKVGISKGVQKGINSIHALRHFPIGDTTGWYIWTGEYSDDLNFFEPLHIEHLKERCPLILPYLGLDSGWRFLLAENGNYVDVWKDDNLLTK